MKLVAISAALAMCLAAPSAPSQTESRPASSTAREKYGSVHFPVSCTPAAQEQFDRAVADSKSLAERPDNATLLKLYALFKQASSGDASGERPGMGDFVARAKWDAWNGLQGISSEEAMKRYIALVNELKA